MNREIDKLNLRRTKNKKLNFLLNFGEPRSNSDSNSKLMNIKKKKKLKIEILVDVQQQFESLVNLRQWIAI